MPRVYRTKGDERLSTQIRIPITLATEEAIAEMAREHNVTKTEFSRSILLKGLGEVMDQTASD